jgi:hypothetical protein
MSTGDFEWILKLGALPWIPYYKGNVPGRWGARVAYLVEALCYKQKGRGFDSRSGKWIFI